MKKILLILILFMMMFVPSFAQNDQLIYYRFEMGVGGIALDSSGNGNNGVLNGAIYDTKLNRLNTGSYSIKFNAAQSVITTITKFGSSNLSMFGSWYKKNNPGINTIFALGNNNSNIFSLKYLDNGVPEKFYLTIKDSNNISQNINLNNVLPGTLLDDTRAKINLVINNSNKKILFYVNGILVHNGTFTFNISSEISNAQDIRIGESFQNVEGIKGNIDDFRLFNFPLNSTQINSLVISNDLVLPSKTLTTPTNQGNITQTIINGTQQLNIINSHSPNKNENVTNIFSMGATLNIVASCDTYIDNNYVSTNENVLGFTNQITGLNTGLHDYFLYCSKIDNNNILQYEITNTTSFFVQPSTPSTINLIFQSSSLNLANYPLFVVTPCLTKSISIPLIPGSPYKMINNQGGVYFSPVNNGVSSFTLQEGTHDFCLINGVGQYNLEGGYSDIWYVNQAEHQEILGKFSVPSNVTQNFVFSIDQSDIYPVTNPKWWNTSWIEIIGSLIAFIIGLILLWAGIEAKDGKIVLVGGLLVMMSLGYQVSNIVFGVLF